MIATIVDNLCGWKLYVFFANVGIEPKTGKYIVLPLLLRYWESPYLFCYHIVNKKGLLIVPQFLQLHWFTYTIENLTSQPFEQNFVGIQEYNATVK